MTLAELLLDDFEVAAVAAQSVRVGPPKRVRTRVRDPCLPQYSLQKKMRVQVLIGCEGRTCEGNSGAPGSTLSRSARYDLNTATHCLLSATVRDRLPLVECFSSPSSSRQ